MITTWQGPPAMLAIFRKFFGSFSARHIIKQNNFSNFQHYFLQKTIPVAMAGWLTTAAMAHYDIRMILMSLLQQVYVHLTVYVRVMCFAFCWTCSSTMTIPETTTPITTIVQHWSMHSVNQ